VISDDVGFILYRHSEPKQRHKTHVPLFDVPKQIEWFKLKTIGIIYPGCKMLAKELHIRKGLYTTLYLGNIKH